MTGKQWDIYFKGITKDHREQLAMALKVLDADPMMNKAFGNSFKELWHIIDYPLSEKPEPTQEQIGKCTKCNQPIHQVRPSLGNGWVSYQHDNQKWDASHDANRQGCVS